MDLRVPRTEIAKSVIPPATIVITLYVFVLASLDFKTDFSVVSDKSDSFTVVAASDTAVCFSFSVTFLVVFLLFQGNLSYP